MTMKKAFTINKRWIWFIPVAVTLFAVWLARQGEHRPAVHIVRKGTFENVIETKGEIQGRDAVKIVLPEIFKDPAIQIWEFKIKDMVDEGTIVKKGDWVASLDQVSLNQRIQSNRDIIDQREAEVKDARIDTSLALSLLRQNIQKKEFDHQYKKLDLEQSKFESPAYQRRIQTAYNQSLREIERMKRDYQLRKMNYQSRATREMNWYNYFKNIDDKLQEALEASTITAPEDGMVIYAKNRHYRKIRVGETVAPDRPVIATLPDLSELLSETFVEEIDISKIKVGDKVEISVEALPGHQFTGYILRIANVGQELSGYDAKVFAVTIHVNETDKKLLPGMTSINRIILNKLPDQLIIPRKCLFSEQNHYFVYARKEGTYKKQPVEVGAENDEVVIIKSGLEERDRILMNPPESESKKTIETN